MNYKILASVPFDKELKQLAKKYPSLKDEYFQIIQSLESNPSQGTPIGKDCYKIRLAIRSKNTGKSGGARIITYVKVIQKTVYLISIYDKSEQANITNQEIENRLKSIRQHK
jgi:mRNA-degrading endonuclease RelE of RelBE toxin-antitoxin system